jgi:hypothetical protein
MQVSEADAALGDHAVGKGLYLVDLAFQHGDLKAIMSVDMDMKRRNRKIMVVVLRRRQSA